ncbi:MAG: DNA polymerase III subunit beta, partial [Deltaproteobacteria bacterium]|nr:DNA polymerase III subunit beta [Deltaproteobacteria bacterium]
QRGMAKRAYLPITANVLIESGDGMLKLTGTDLEVMVKVNLDAESDAKAWAVCVPPKILDGILKGIKDANVSLSVSSDVLTITDEGGSSTIQGMSAMDYPVTPKTGNGERLEITGLPTMLAGISHAMATEKSRPVLHGVSMNIGTDGVVMLAAADSHRLGVADGTHSGNIKAERKTIIPFNTVKVLSKIFSDDAITVTIDADKPVSFEQGNVTVISQLIQGRFPDYTQLIPDCTYQCTVAVQGLADALVRVKNAAKEGSGVIRLTSNKGTMTIGCRSEEIGSVEVALPCEGDIKIAANWSYLNDLVGVLKGVNDVTIGTTDLSSPIKAINGDFTYVLMPMF